MHVKSKRVTEQREFQDNCCAGTSGFGKVAMGVLAVLMSYLHKATASLYYNVVYFFQNNSTMLLGQGRMVAAGRLGSILTAKNAESTAIANQRSANAFTILRTMLRHDKKLHLVPEDLSLQKAG